MFASENYLFEPSLFLSWWDYYRFLWGSILRVPRGIEASKTFPTIERIQFFKERSHGRRLRRLCEASGGRLTSLAYTPRRSTTLALTTVKKKSWKSLQKNREKYFRKKLLLKKKISSKKKFESGKKFGKKNREFFFLIFFFSRFSKKKNFRRNLPCDE